MYETNDNDVLIFKIKAVSAVMGDERADLRQVSPHSPTYCDKKFLPKKKKKKKSNPIQIISKI